MEQCLYFFLAGIGELAAQLSIHVRERIQCGECLQLVSLQAAPLQCQQQPVPVNLCDTLLQAKQQGCSVSAFYMAC